MFTKSIFNPTNQKSALYLEKQKSWKNSVKCALCSGVRSDLSAPFKSPSQKKLKFLEKLVEKQRKCAKYPHWLFYLLKKVLKQAKTLKTFKLQQKKFRFFSVCALRGKKKFLY
jgi:hypothetical protein